MYCLWGLSLSLSLSLSLLLSLTPNPLIFSFYLLYLFLSTPFSLFLHIYQERWKKLRDGGIESNVCNEISVP
jgi:hypothetical protein